MKELVQTILLLLIISSCSSNHGYTHEDKQKYYDNQISFYEKEAQHMHEIGADGNESIYRDKVTTLKNEKQAGHNNDSFIDFIFDILFN